jgi:hypothetical protein
MMMRQLEDAKAEIEVVRVKFGYIQVDDPSLTYVSRFPSEWAFAYRVVVPAGSRYMLHLTDQALEDDKQSKGSGTTKSISLNGWRDGSDAVLSYEFDTAGKPPTLVVRCNADDFFNYSPPDWKSGTRSENGRGLKIETGEQEAFSVDKTIEFMYRENPATKRGLRLWLEPYPVYKARQKKKDAV